MQAVEVVTGLLAIVFAAIAWLWEQATKHWVELFLSWALFEIYGLRTTVASLGKRVDWLQRQAETNDINIDRVFDRLDTYRDGGTSATGATMEDHDADRPR
ncbi:hypothetical protein N5I84_03330 [Ralstonia sp. CHL-2022]|uniref:hypothetical protein n=1 Tax=Ralstonia mojiangensis TaxID=2953895 RepID=UPI0021B2A81C|nr:hypothetical protein [Ralstonia mojiangensis]MCT7295189.1 hypothetical protein [Ralstonia mojiangensis]